MEQPFDQNHEFDTDSVSNKIRNTETQELFESEKSPFKLSDTLSLDGIYEHYKSTFQNPKYYLVTGVTENTETGECYVIYKPLYETDEPDRLARPLKMFTEEVEVDGGFVPRFRFVTDDTENFT